MLRIRVFEACLIPDTHSTGRTHSLLNNGTPLHLEQLDLCRVIFSRRKSQGQQAKIIAI